MPNSHLVRDFMTPHPKTIGYDQSLEAASLSMREMKVRHLPVLKGGELIGVVSDRDINLVLNLSDKNGLHLPVEEAMAADLYFTTPDASMVDVASIMAKKKFGSALVMEGTKLVGIFTAIDALTALSALLKEQ